MKPVLFLFITFVITVSAFSQPVKTVKLQSGSKYNMAKEQFSVLRDNDTIRHGLYQRFRNETLVEQGSYNQNQKDGSWKLFDNTQLVSEKEYISGNRFGTWKAYKVDGALEWEYDCSTNTFSGTPFTAKVVSYENEKGEWISDPNLSNATRLTGLVEWTRFLNETLRYPIQAIDEEIQGTVQVEITMDTTGAPVEYNVALPAKMQLVPESLRVVRLYKPEIIPYEKDGKRVRVKIRVPLTYRLARG